MAYLVHPLPPRKVWVKKEYLYDLEKGHGELTPGLWISVRSIQAKALYFETLLTDYGALFDKLPLSAFVWKEDYDPDDQLENGLVVIEAWRDSRIGDWVRADDDCIIQVLRKGQMIRKYGRNKVREYVGTCTGTFPVGKNVKMDTSRRVNIYTFGGSKSSEDILLDRTTLTRCELVFVQFLASGLSPREAYLKAFPIDKK